MAKKGLRELVAFRIDAEEFAVDILSVQEINRVIEVTRIPNAPGHVQGVINLRGKIIPVVDLRRMLGFSQKETDSQSRIMVVEVRGMVLGFIVDSVSEVVRLPGTAVKNALLFSSSVEPGYIDGVGKLDERLLILLNLDRMFVTPESQRGFASD